MYKFELWPSGTDAQSGRNEVLEENPVKWEKVRQRYEIWYLIFVPVFPSLLVVVYLI
jgi:hypothetical protein